MEKEEKYLYCPKCKNYPDAIVEEEIVMTWRVWDGECYEGVKSENTGKNLHNYCQECDTELIDNADKKA